MTRLTDTQAVLLSTAQRESGGPDAARRTEGNLSSGLFVTPAGLAAIGVEQEGADELENGGAVLSV